MPLGNNKFSFGPTSLKRLQTCHIDLQALAHEMMARTDQDFGVVCGKRGKAAQEDAFNRGASKAHYGESPHNNKPSDGLDMVPYGDGNYLWKDVDAINKLAKLARECADDLFHRGIIKERIIWGNDWDDDGIPVGLDPDENFIDMPHYERKNWRKRS